MESLKKKEESCDAILTGKRPAVEGTSNDAAPPPKRSSSAVAAANDDATSTKTRIAPIRLLRTADEKGQSSSPASQFSMSLREVLGFDGNRPDASIDWLVISNYLIDPEFLLNEIPELVSVPCTVVFYGYEESSFMGWKNMVGEEAIDLRCLRPSDPIGPTNPLGQIIHYGVHHTKLFLVGFSDGTLRVVVHTANLRYVDIHLKSQGLYIQDFPLKKTSNTTPSPFETTLLDYLDTYRYTEPRCWLRGSKPEFLRGLIRRYDFGSACAVLVASVPGYHRVDAKELKGHLKLRRAIVQHTVPNGSGPVKPIVCQFSSMGSLSEKWMHEFQTSLDTRLARRAVGAARDTSALRIKIVYPSVEEVRRSVEGYRGGCSVPGSTKNVSKQFLGPLYHRWGSKPASNTAPNPLWKPNHVPHIKTYFQLSSDQQAVEYFVLSSHNLSKAAWGELNSDARHLFIRHWELGVFISPQLLGCDRLLPWQPNAVNLGKNDCVVPLPFSPTPTRYGFTDIPWAVDGTYNQPDAFGRKSATE